MPIDWGSRIAAAEARAKDWARQIVANLVQVSPLSSSDSKRGGFRVEGRPSSSSFSQAARLMQHAGFQSRALAATQFVKLLVEGGAAKALLVAEDDGVDLGLAEGEAALYSPAKPAAKVVATAGGGLQLKTDGTADAVFQDGDKKVATDLTPTDNGTIAMTAVAVPGPPPVTTVTFTWAPPSGTPQIIGTLQFTSGLLTSATPALSGIGMTGKVKGGSPHLLAPQGT